MVWVFWIGYFVGVVVVSLSMLTVMKLARVYGWWNEDEAKGEKDV